MEGIAELVFMAMLVITAMIISAVVKSVRKAMEEDPQRQNQQQREGAASGRTPREELDDFVRVLTGGQPAQRHKPPAPPQPPQRRRQTAYDDGGIRRPDEGSEPKPPQRVGSVQQAVKQVKKPKRRFERKTLFADLEEEKRPGEKRKLWYDRLPRDERKRAIVLREAFGPPLGMKRGWPDPYQTKGRLYK